jgi:hypothetical protein
MLEVFSDVQDVVHQELILEKCKSNKTIYKDTVHYL